MKKVFVLAWLMALFFSAKAQTSISGRLTHRLDGKALAGINVMIKDKANLVTLGYVASDQNGSYHIRFSSSQDSVLLLVTGLTIEKQQHKLANRNQVLALQLNSQAIALKEVKISPPKIRKIGDTISYWVDGFADQYDRTIADVLRKMPGIEVKADGSILYRNKPINKFYIEDKDLLQGRYGIATNAIEAKDVASVQVLENHQAVKALSDREFSDEAAINLKLKDDAKSKLIANAKLGLGVAPVLWDNELVAMRFNKFTQQINSYGGNNIGRDPAANLKLQYTESIKPPTAIALGVQLPLQPAVSQNRYLFNAAHVFAVNQLFTLGKDNQLNVNINYVNDRRQKSSFSRSSYYLSLDSVLLITEELSAKERIEELVSSVKLTRNKESFYLDNQLDLSGKWNRVDGSVDGSEKVNQDLRLPSYGFKNSFNLVRNHKKATLRVSSQQLYQDMPQTLAITPMRYGNLFGNPSGGLGLQQELRQQQFFSVNKLSIGHNGKNWKQNYAVGVNVNSTNFRSSLQVLPTAASEEIDSLSNSLQWSRYDFYFSPDLTYAHQKLKITAALPLTYALLNTSDRLSMQQRSNTRLMLNKSLTINYELSLLISLSASVRQNNSLGEISDGFTGFLMQSYRNLVRNDGQLPEKQDQSYQFNFYYRHPLHGIFVNLNASYFTNKSNLLAAYDYQGVLAIRKNYAMDNIMRGHSFQAQLSKAVDAIGGTAKLDLAYTSGTGNQISQGELLKFGNRNFRLGPSLTAVSGSWASLAYRLQYSQANNRLIGSLTNLKPIHSASQNTRLSFFPTKSIAINLAHEYFYVNAVARGKNSMHFADLGMRYTVKDMQFSLAYDNIFNAKQYISAVFNEVSSYYTAYNLRPAQLMLGLRFKLK
jgi:hypothetical protein